jgi:hypothetical protein
MHKNIAQISRWWVADTIISDSLDLPLMWNASLNNSIDYQMTSLFMESYPSNIASLPMVLDGEPSMQESEKNNSINNVPTPSFQASHPKQAYPQGKSPSPTSSKSSYMPPTQETDQDTMDLTNNCHCSSASKQRSIEQWAIHRPFIPNTALKPITEHNPLSPTHPHEVFHGTSQTIWHPTAHR